MDGAIIYRHKQIRKKRDKVAVFDVDWTLIKPKEGRRFPKEVSDWQWLRPSVPVVVRRYHREGYRIFFLTDQTKDWKVDMIKTVCGELDVPVVAIIAMKKEIQKPNDGLFRKVIEGEDYNWEESVYVGDAAGREGDWADVDKRVAEKLGLKFLTPEEVFPLPAVQERVIEGREKEVVIMVGYPGAGKSTVARKLAAAGNYYLVEGDAVGGTIARMLQAGEKGLASGSSSIIFDATNGTREKRAAFLDFARKHGLGVRCVWVNVGIDVAMEQNKERGGKVIPDVVFYTYRKRFEAPTMEECEVVTI